MQNLDGTFWLSLSGIAPVRIKLFVFFIPKKVCIWPPFKNALIAHTNDFNQIDSQCPKANQFPMTTEITYITFTLLLLHFGCRHCFTTFCSGEPMSM